MQFVSAQTIIKDHYRSDIDGLRAVAVLSVVGFHAFPSLVRGGFVGVDIFFVISGFLISGIIFTAMEARSFGFVQFYARRIRRIFPALSLILLCALVFGWLLLLPDEFKQLGKHIAASGAFANNFLLWMETGYFDTAATQKPLLHLWSLCIEEQYYLTYPLLVWWIWRKSFALATLVTLFVMSLLLNAILIGGHPTTTFFSLPTRAWQLLAGGLIAYANLRMRPTDLRQTPFRSIVRVDWISALPVRLCDIIGAFGFFFILCALSFINSTTPYPGIWAMLPTSGACCIIAAGNGSFINCRILSHPWLVFIGLISYPLYLWHWILQSFAHIMTSDSATTYLRIGLVLLSFALACITYRAVELPLRTGANAIPKTIGLVIALATIALAGVGIYRGNGSPSRYETDYLARLQDVTDSGPGPSDKTNCPASLSSVSLASAYCRASSNEAPTAVIWGDSHAAHFYDGVAKLDNNRPWLLLGHFSCPPTSEIEVSADAPDCTSVNNTMLSFINTNTSIKTVTLVFYGNYIAQDNYAADHVARQSGPAQIGIKVPGMPTLNKAQSFAFGLRAAVASLRSSGKRVIIVVDVPELPFSPRHCLERPFVSSNACYVSKADVDRRQHEFRDVIDSIPKQYSDVTIFDPLDLICSGESCGPIKDDISLYVDSHHLSQRGSEIVARKFLDIAR